MRGEEAKAGSPAVDDQRLQALIDSLVENPKDEAAEREFWHLFCNLPGWVLLTTEEDARKAAQDDRPDIQVQMFQDGDRALLPVFSSVERAKDVVAEHDLACVSMPPPAALAYMCGLRGRIDGFIVNPVPGKSGGFGHRLPDLCAFYRQERGVLPAGAIHCAIDHARNSKHPAAFFMVHEIIAGLEKIYVGVKDQGFAFVKEGEHLWLWAFSDAAMAVRACQQHEGLKMIEATPAELAERVEKAVAESEGRIKGAVLNHPENSMAIDMGLLKRAFETRG